MTHPEKTELFEKALFAHVEMCYGVALALTRDPHDARELTQDVVTWAWHRRDHADGTAGIKMKLLTALRENYLQHYRHPLQSRGNEATLAVRA